MHNFSLHNLLLQKVLIKHAVIEKDFSSFSIKTESEIEIYGQNLAFEIYSPQ